MIKIVSQILLITIIYFFIFSIAIYELLYNYPIMIGHIDLIMPILVIFYLLTSIFIGLGFVALLQPRIGAFIVIPCWIIGISLASLSTPQTSYILNLARIYILDDLRSLSDGEVIYWKDVKYQWGLDNHFIYLMKSETINSSTLHISDPKFSYLQDSDCLLAVERLTKEFVLIHSTCG